MERCKILLLDSPQDIALLMESLEIFSISLNIQSVTSITDMLTIIQADQPDLIMIGSSLVIHEGFESFLNLGDIPIVILCESYGMHRFFKNDTCNVCFITKPLDFEKIPEMIMKAIEFMASCKEGF